MQDFLLVAAPPAAVAYFIVYPQQFMDGNPKRLLNINDPQDDMRCNGLRVIF
jgi:hypothetical protein